MTTLFTLFLIVGLAGIWFFTKKNPDKSKRNISIIVSIVSFLGFGIFTEINKKREDKEPTEIVEVTKDSSSSVSETVETTINSSSTEEVNSDDKFYEINKIKEEYQPGSQIIDIEHYNDFTEGVLTFEGVFTKFGLPSNAIGAEEGDAQMEVIYPTNEDGNSVGLIFKRESTSFGEWTLKEKYVVKTDGVSIPVYK